MTRYLMLLGISALAAAALAVWRGVRSAMLLNVVKVKRSDGEVAQVSAGVGEVFRARKAATRTSSLTVVFVIWMLYNLLLDRSEMTSALAVRVFQFYLVTVVTLALTSGWIFEMGAKQQWNHLMRTRTAIQIAEKLVFIDDDFQIDEGERIAGVSSRLPGKSDSELRQLVQMPVRYSTLLTYEDVARKCASEIQTAQQNIKHYDHLREKLSDEMYAQLDAFVASKCAQGNGWASDTASVDRFLREFVEMIWPSLSEQLKLNTQAKNCQDRIQASRTIIARCQEVLVRTSGLLLGGETITSESLLIPVNDRDDGDAD